MLRRIFLSILLTLPIALIAANTRADDGVNDSFCHGYIIKALGEFPVDGLDRNNLWLAWNETVRLTIIEGELNETSYQAGRDRFSQQLAANNVEGMVDISDGDCELGRNPIWVWW